MSFNGHKGHCNIVLVRESVGALTGPNSSLHFAERATRVSGIDVVHFIRRYLEVLLPR
jgi:hypothetical protein